MKYFAAALVVSMSAYTQDDRIAALIEKLGDDKGSVREEATRELGKLGKKALDDLRKAAQNKDPEIAARARRLIDDVDWPEPGIAVDGLAITIKAKSEYVAGGPIVLRAKIINVCDHELTLDGLEAKGESHRYLLDLNEQRGLHLCYHADPAEARPDLPGKATLKPGGILEFTFSPRVWCAWTEHSKCHPLQVGNGGHKLSLALAIPKGKNKEGEWTGAVTSNEVRFAVKP